MHAACVKFCIQTTHGELFEFQVWLQSSLMEGEFLVEGEKNNGSGVSMEYSTCSLRKDHEQGGKNSTLH